jgi:TonB family protein
MKHSVGFVVLCFLVLWGSGRGFAESAGSAVFGTNDDEFLVQFEIYYSPERGTWVTARPGKLFSTGPREAGYTLPELQGPPEAIRYPAWAVEREWEGTLVVAIEIYADGSVGRWKIMRSSGHAMLDRAAVRAIRRWKFDPAREKGRPIASCVQVPVRFVIDKN